MLNNFTTSIFYRYVWAISRGGKMMSWVSLCSPLDCRKCWSKLLPAIIEHRTLGFRLQTFWKVTNGSGQSCRWYVFVYCMVQLLKKLYFSPKCQIWLQTLTSAHFGPFYWWKCRANQSGKYEKSVREIGFGVGKKSASAAKVWPSDPGFLIQLNWLFCSLQERGLAVLRAEFGWITICHNYKWVMIARCWVPLAAGRPTKIMRELE